jgi:hypothetical protein
MATEPGRSARSQPRYTRVVHRPRSTPRRRQEEPASGRLGWNSCGTEEAKRVAKVRAAETNNWPELTETVATGCRLDRMVRRGSPVRVRKRRLIACPPPAAQAACCAPARASSGRSALRAGAGAGYVDGIACPRVKHHAAAATRGLGFRQTCSDCGVDRGSQPLANVGSESATATTRAACRTKMRSLPPVLTRKARCLSLLLRRRRGKVAVTAGVTRAT